MNIMSTDKKLCIHKIECFSLPHVFKYLDFLVKYHSLSYPHAMELSRRFTFNTNGININNVFDAAMAIIDYTDYDEDSMSTIMNNIINQTVRVTCEVEELGEE